MPRREPDVVRAVENTEQLGKFRTHVNFIFQADVMQILHLEF